MKTMVTTQRCFTTLLASLIVLAFSISPKTAICALPDYASYSPPVLRGPYTLSYRVDIVKQPQELAVRIGHPLPTQSGTVTISNNGKRLLYHVQFGKWDDVIITDKASDTDYQFDNTYMNAIVQRGALTGITSMELLPFPGIGYDFYPMLRGFNVSKSGATTAEMVCLGSVMSADNGIIGDFVYAPTTVTMGSFNEQSVISTAAISIANYPELTDETWAFSNYTKLGAIPIAQTIDRVLYVGQGVSMVKHVTTVGNMTTTTESQVGWPPKTMIPDGEYRFTLLSISEIPRPDSRFQLESYLPDGIAISDARNYLAKNPAAIAGNISYTFHPQNGSIEQQSIANGNASRVPPDKIVNQ